MSSLKIGIEISVAPVSDDESEQSVGPAGPLEVSDIEALALEFQHLSTRALAACARKDGVAQKALVKLAKSTLKKLNVIRVLSADSGQSILSASLRGPVGY